jgi:hypothetical protein
MQAPDDFSERLMSAFRALVRGVHRRVDYFALYPAKVLKDHGDNHVDVQPDDPILPALVRVRVDTFMPGVKLEVAAGARVLLGFSGGNPAAPRCQLWESGELVKVTISAGTVVVASDDVRMGGDSPGKRVALAEDVKSAIDALKSTFNAHGHGVAGFFAVPTESQMGPTPSLASSVMRAD